MRNSYDTFHQRELNIQKGVQNESVRSLMDKHYKSLFQSLVHNEFDEETFNDTYIRITGEYDGEQDFKDLFKKLFKQLKGEYYRNEKAMRCSSVPMDENFDMPGDDEEEPTEENPDDIDTTQKLLDYADTIQAKKTK